MLGASGNVHTHGVVEGEGRERASFYREELKSLWRGGEISVDLSKLKLRLDDEDVRYTTEPRPGIYAKVVCVDLLHQCWPERTLCYVLTWDLYSAHGMDVLYSMMLPLCCEGARTLVVGVSLAHDEREMARFKRMRANVEALQAACDKVGECELYAMSALDFCKEWVHSGERKADVLVLSPPWMASHGELKSAHERGVLRTSRDIACEAGELLESLGSEGLPRVISLMVPQDWEEYQSLPAFSGYVCAESMLVEKVYRAGRGRPSSYWVHLLVLRERAGRIKEWKQVKMRYCA